MVHSDIWQSLRKKNPFSGTNIEVELLSSIEGGTNVR